MKTLPLWFNIWWILNIILMAMFLLYWYSIDFSSNKFIVVYILYSNLWGLWAARFRKKNKT